MFLVISCCGLDGGLRTSVMFVSISFIVLMMISLAWLVFYYIQRFRYLHAKDRLSVGFSTLFSEFALRVCCSETNFDRMNTLFNSANLTCFATFSARVDECCPESSFENPH